MEINVFSSIGSFVNQVLAGALSQQTNQLISFIAMIFVSAMILYVLTQGFLIISGRVENPLNDVFFKLVSLFLIMTIATDVGGYLSVITGAIDGLKDLAIAGSSNPYVKLDQLLTQKILLIGDIWANKKMPYFYDLVAIVATLIGTLLLLIPLGMALLINDISLKILLAFAPLFIFCLSFQFIRGMFNNWLQLCFSNVLYFVVLSIVMKLFMNLDPLVKFSTDNVVAYSAMLIIIGWFAKDIISMAKEISSGIASVSAEGVGTSFAHATGRAINAGAHGIAGNITSKVAKPVSAVDNAATKGIVKAGTMIANPALSATMKAISKVR